MADIIEIEAGRDEVEALLKRTLTAEQLAQVEISETEPSQDPFDPNYRGEGVTIVTVLVFVGQAVAAGAAYDIAKTAFTAAYGAAQVHFKKKPDDTKPAG